MSQLVATEGDQLAPAELYPLCLLLLLAGFETTVNLIGNTVLALLDRPDQWRAVAEDPALAAAAVEETLRWDPPVQRTVRTPTGRSGAGRSRRAQGVDGRGLPGRGEPRPQRVRRSRRGSTSPGPAGRSIWPSRPASTTAWALRWPGSRRPWPCNGWSSASRGWSAPGRLRRRNGTVIRGPAELVVGQSTARVAA